LWNEFKDVYKKRYNRNFPLQYENRRITPEIDQITDKYQTELLKNVVPRKTVVPQGTTSVARMDNRNLVSRMNPNLGRNVPDRFLNKIRLLNINPENPSSNKNDIRGLQGELYELGYKMDNSWSSKQGGWWDGVYGPETKAALKDWQAKQKRQ